MNEEDKVIHKISKELLEEVLGISVISMCVRKTYIIFYQTAYHDDTMQIDEFFCKCLEYTFTEDYTLYFHKWSGVEENEFYFQCIDVESGLQFSTERNYKQALFSACEEIMKSKETNNDIKENNDKTRMVKTYN